MATVTRIPLAEYLSTVYDPDFDYLEGVLEARTTGEISHAKPSRLSRSILEPGAKAFSPEYRVASIQDRIDDYLAFGIACVWVVNPETQRAWIHTGEASREAKDGILRTSAGDLAIPLASIFDP